MKQIVTIFACLFMVQISTAQVKKKTPQVTKPKITSIKRDIVMLRKELKTKIAQFPSKNPVYIIHDEVHTALDFIDTLNIEKIEVLLPSAAIKKYGQEAKNGALVIKEIKGAPYSTMQDMDKSQLGVVDEKNEGNQNGELVTSYHEQTITFVLAED